jgi:hypothetical protein
MHRFQGKRLMTLDAWNTCITIHRDFFCSQLNPTYCLESY